jgi:hypothetical protein
MCVSSTTISKLYLHHHKVYLFILLLTCHTMTIISISILLAHSFYVPQWPPIKHIACKLFLTIFGIGSCSYTFSKYHMMHNFPLLSKLFSSPSPSQMELLFKIPCEECSQPWNLHLYVFKKTNAKEGWQGFDPTLMSFEGSNSRKGLLKFVFSATHVFNILAM